MHSVFFSKSCPANRVISRTDAMMSYETVHHNDALSLETERFSGHVGSYQTAEYSVLLSLNVLNITQNAILTLGVLLVILLAAFEISSSTLTVATFVSILAYVTQLQAPLQFFGSFYNQVQNNLIDAERMLSLVSYATLFCVEVTHSIFAV